nr:MAG TPA: hypothetical protein [Caudoviricetes sp.]DAH38135.1 MAG TPA: hypothetical protein [Caudoviricetes sp.]DAO49819.1 MAG TPA: hypothetical protein [Caudoviricetes sp.]
MCRDMMSPANGFYAGLVTEKRYDRSFGVPR